jgi:hypothetical protein
MYSAIRCLLSDANDLVWEQRIEAFSSQVKHELLVVIAVAHVGNPGVDLPSATLGLSYPVSPGQLLQCRADRAARNTQVLGDRGLGDVDDGSGLFVAHQVDHHSDLGAGQNTRGDQDGEDVCVEPVARQAVALLVRVEHLMLVPVLQEDLRFPDVPGRGSHHGIRDCFGHAASRGRLAGAATARRCS